MAKQQYRVTTDSNGTSSFGFAYLAIINPSGSGKKMTLRSLEVALHSVMNTSTVLGAIPCTLFRGAGPLDGEDMVLASACMDSATAMPSTVKVRRSSSMPGSTTVLSRANLSRKGAAVGTQNRVLFGTPTGLGKRGRRPLGGLGVASRGGFNTEPITLRQNEAVALVMDAKVESATNPMRVTVTLSMNGKTATWDFCANTYPGMALFSVENTGTNPVQLLNWAVSEMGTTDTPTLRVVPIGQMYAPNVNDNSRKNVGVIKMDSSYSAFPGLLYTDIGFIPQGVPEVAISPASAGTPAGMNYLHTRDFWGPMYRNLLVEGCHMKGVGSGIPDTFGLSYQHHGNDLLFRRAGITLNEGEGIAIVNSAETAVAVQAAFGAWQPMTFSAQVDVEPSIIPNISASGMIPGSRYRVEKVSDNSLVTTGIVDGTGSFTYSYTVEDTPLNMKLIVRKSSSAPYYKSYEVTFNLTQAGVSIPVSQTLDE